MLNLCQTAHISRTLPCCSALQTNGHWSRYGWVTLCLLMLSFFWDPFKFLREEKHRFSPVLWALLWGWLMLQELFMHFTRYLFNVNFRKCPKSRIPKSDIHLQHPVGTNVGKGLNEAICWLKEWDKLQKESKIIKSQLSASFTELCRFWISIGKKKIIPDVVLKIIEHVKWKHHPEALVLKKKKKKSFQVLYKLSCETPVYNRENFRYKYLGTAPLYL